MIHLLCKVPNKITIACSGGVDSIAAAHFLNMKKRRVELAFFHHGTDDSEKGLAFVRRFAQENNLNLTIGYLTRDKDKEESHEEFWRNERYKFLHSLNDFVVTAHTLDDVVETWLFYQFRNVYGKLIPYQNRNVIRPFLLTRKSDLQSWCINKGVDWYEDKSNENVYFSRNRIRHKILPEILVINPGIHKTVKKLLIEKIKSENIINSNITKTINSSTTKEI